MKILVFALALIGLSLQTTGGKVQWDYNDQDLTFGVVDSFKVCYDSTNCTQTVLANITKVSSVNGISTYQLPIPQNLVQGQHTVTVQACNADSCGAAAGPLAFQWPLPTLPVPNKVLNLKVVK